MDEVEGGLGRFLAKVDQDFEFLAKADRDFVGDWRYLATRFFGRESRFFVSTPLTFEEGRNLYIYEFALHFFFHILSYNLHSLFVFVFVYLGSASGVSIFICLCVVVYLFVFVFQFVYLCVYAASLGCSSFGLNSKYCTKFSLISSQFNVWPQDSSILYHLFGISSNFLGKMSRHTLSSL